MRNEIGALRRLLDRVQQAAHVHETRGRVERGARETDEQRGEVQRGRGGRGGGGEGGGGSER